MLPALLALPASGLGAPASEDQVKAVFLYNFTHFVEWPASSQEAAFVIGVLGNDAFAAQIENAVRGEQVAARPLQVRRYRGVADIDDCQILFIDREVADELPRVLNGLSGRSTLTVSDLSGAARRGVMIQFATDARRLRLLINVDAARAAGLTISSKLLRPAEIVP
jgi:hypothetical protein